ncbi:MAG: hypothetical protein EBS01_11870, partial [Verrucomicrobia bacterium]|nr:hypothetical protein [Verrucomicrobiota bacterium]
MISGINDQIITVTNNNGYGLVLSADMVLGTTGTPTFNIVTANDSNKLAGLTISGTISGGRSGSSLAPMLLKTGLGTLLLTGTNTFGSSASFIDVRDGVLAASGASALGNSGNLILLNSASGKTSTFRATDTFTLDASTTASIKFGGLSPSDARKIEVVEGKTLTINSALDTTALSWAALKKGENGTLVLNGDNSGWLGNLTIDAGVLRAANNAALGSTVGTTTVSNNVGAALQLAGVTTSETLSLSNSGINFAGALQAYSGVNTASGAITLANDATIGADANASLTLTGGITGARNLTLAGSGALVISTTALGAVSSLTKIGTGSVDLQVASSSYITALTLNAGTMTLSAGGVIGSAAV